MALMVVDSLGDVSSSIATVDFCVGLTVVVMRISPGNEHMKCKYTARLSSNCLSTIKLPRTTIIRLNYSNNINTIVNIIIMKKGDVRNVYSEISQCTFQCYYQLLCSIK